MQVVRQATGAGAEHECIADVIIAVQNMTDLLERGFVFLVSPRPVPMHVRVVGIQSLIGGQPGSQGEIRFVSCLRGVHIHGFKYLLQRVSVFLRGPSLIFQAFARQHMKAIVLEFEIDTMNILTQMPE